MTESIKLSDIFLKKAEYFNEEDSELSFATETSSQDENYHHISFHSLHYDKHMTIQEIFQELEERNIEVDVSFVCTFSNISNDKCDIAIFLYHIKDFETVKYYTAKGSGHNIEEIYEIHRHKED